MKAILLATTALAGFFVFRAVAGKRSGPVAPSGTPGTEIAEVNRRFVLNVVFPVWLAAGVADWACHRATSIETTTGPKESAMHLLLLTEAAIPVVGGMFLEITAPVLALMIIAVLLHDATVLWDISYAVTKREVKPVEQHVHGLLQLAPMVSASFVSVLHWPQFLALFGIGPDRPDWSIRWKSDPSTGLHRDHAGGPNCSRMAAPLGGIRAHPWCDS